MCEHCAKLSRRSVLAGLGGYGLLGAGQLWAEGSAPTDHITTHAPTDDSTHTAPELGHDMAPSGAKSHPHKAHAILLSCMDYRLVDDLVRHMDADHMTNDYDHMVLAGASLGAVHPIFSAWHQVFWDHVQLAVTLHAVEEIVAIDHRDCGAYKLALGEASLASPTLETQAHQMIMGAFAQQAKIRFPALRVRGFLMGLDGQAESLMTVS